MSDSTNRHTSMTLMADTPAEQRPREKALAYGIKSLTDAELMAIIFSTGIRGKSVVKMCAEILDDNGGHISKVARMDVREFISRYSGIGPAKALTMLAALELGARAAADELVVADPEMKSSQLAYRYMLPYFQGLDHEEFWVLLLRQNLKVIKAVKVGQGGLTGTAVDAKVIVREALLSNSPALMLFHNHPSGNLLASPQDLKVTRRIVDAAALFDIRVLDHIIVAGSDYHSFHDEGQL